MSGRKRRPKREPKRKRLSRESAVGQLGVNLVEKIVTEMGSRWSPTAELEVGIDGYIELFDPTTREATGLHLSAQSKAVTRFSGDAQKVTFTCKREDIAYWLTTSPRVILVVSQPSSGEAYWLSIHDYFGSPEHADGTIATFDRSTQRFSPSSYDALLEVARPADRAVTRSPVAVQETLYSNLIPLEASPTMMFVAAATYSDYRAARARLREDTDEFAPRTWALRDNMLFSFTDPSEGLLARLVDSGTVEQHDTSEWAASDDEEKRRVFVELLNNSLTADLGSLGVRFHRDDRVFAFKGTPDRVPRIYTFQNVHRESSITVVQQYVSRSKDGREFPYLRHTAFRGRFRRLERAWFLEVTPTYRFTTDGIRKYRFHEDRLAGIKRIEGNRAVLSQVLLWNDALQGRPTLFSKGVRLLRFGSCVTLHLDRGIPDADWTPVARISGDETDEAQLELLDRPTGTAP
jgi:hypothetical protein